MSVSVPVPGTEKILESENLSSRSGLDGNESIILIPTPSDDPDDPLNWSARRKALATFCWAIYSLVNGIALSNLYSILESFSEARGLSLSVLNAGTGYLFLLAGWGLLFWQPFALQYGKRITYIVSLIALLAFSLWSPYCTTSGQWYARCILSGFFAAPIEALPELSVADLYFSHERGRYMGLYGLVLVGSNYIAPIIFGFVNDGQGYKWVFYWSAIFCGVAVIFLFFFMEETNYDRSFSTHFTDLTADSTEVLNEQDNTVKTNQNIIETVETHRQRTISSKKSYLSKLALVKRSKPFVMHKRLYLQLQYLLWPVPLFAGFAYGSNLIWFNVFNATSSLVFSSPPYNFKPSIVGLTYVALLIGVIMAFVFTGRFSDYLAMRLARRNGGVLEPEYRLWLFGANVILLPAGLLVWGVGSAHGVHWIGLCIAMVMLGFANTCGATISVNYLVDSYRELTGDAMTTVILVRNTMSFAINYGITPWIDNLGRQNAFISEAVIAFVVAAGLLLMIWAGKPARRAYAERYWKNVADQNSRIAAKKI